MSILHYLLQSNCLENIHSTGGNVSSVRSSFGFWLLEYSFQFVDHRTTGVLMFEYFLVSQNIVL